MALPAAPSDVTRELIETMRAIAQLKREFPELLVITDVCLCEYMSHGHCGIVEKRGQNAEILNDPTLQLLAETAVSIFSQPAPATGIYAVQP